MFSGIVEESALVADIHSDESTFKGAKLTMLSRLNHGETKIGDSISIDGVCLTVVSIVQESLTQWRLSFDLSSETLRCTTFGGVKKGDAVHLERSLQMGARIHGHLVTGHVDGTALLISRDYEGLTLRLQFELASPSPYVVEKGSISLAGVSLTVGAVEDNKFCVYLIPHTNEVTKLGKLALGSRVNIEYDIFARYLERFVIFQNRPPTFERNS